jgi:BirA family biotin operon repressor/biotin-[acetyl-CoA-carboxylase] ligase
MAGWPAGYDRLILEDVDSTNAEARRRIGAPNPPSRPLWIAARRQTAGRGRQGRSWASPAGNLAATLLIARDEPPAALARLSFRAALAVADLFAHHAPDAEVATKWPNDVLLNGRKAAGILLESFGPGARPGGGHAANLAIGIGVNLAHHPDPAEARWPPTSLAAETGHALGFEEAFTLLANRLDHWLRVPDFADVRAAWLARATGLGRRMEVRLPDRTLSGTFEDVDAEGTLVLRTPQGPRRISAGDIHFAE